MLKKIYLYRRYLLTSFSADLRYRYAGTALGIFWVFINPILEVLIYTVVFTQILNVNRGGLNGLSYLVFLTSGLFPFVAFAQMITRGSNAIKSNALYMRRSLVPAEVFVFKEAMLSGFSFLIYLVLLVLISLIAGNPLTWHLFLMPVFALLLLLLGFGIAISLANLRILFPDLGEIIPVILQLWRWTLPIMFTDDGFPVWLRNIMMLNPPYYFIRSFRDVMINHNVPSLTMWVIMAIWINLFLALSQIISRKLSNEVKDLL